MQESMTIELKALVGDAIWCKAQKLASYYQATRQASRGHRHQKAAAAAAAEARKRQNQLLFPTSTSFHFMNPTDLTKSADDNVIQQQDDGEEVALVEEV